MNRLLRYWGLSAVCMVLSGGTSLAESQTAESRKNTAALVKQTSDKLIAARLAAIDGGYEKCASLSDSARRSPYSHWRAHQVFASCTVFDAEEKKKTLSAKSYAEKLESAVDALEFLIEAPGVLVHQNQRESVSFMIEEIGKKARAARAKVGAQPSSEDADKTAKN